MLPIEYAGNHKQDFESAELVRPTSTRSAAEVRVLLAARQGFPQMRDLRQLGCPDVLFERLLEARALRMGLSRESRTLPPATPVENEDAARIRLLTNI